jgi:flagellar operon protein
MPEILKDRSVRRPANTEATFQEMLREESSAQSSGQVKFSAHALQRLQMRKISLTADDLKRVDGAVAKAAAKGARESLLVMNNNLALIVSVKNRTVITAVDGPSMKENVFTNIDSAVFL